ncbi:MAG TPA: alpha/beta hydrolase [Candidatus Dormibacteraeota bacterium]
MTLQSGMIRLGDLDVHQTHGGRGKPVLFIHGLGSSGYMEWRFNLEPTAQHHHVYAPDLPGFGRSEKPRARYGVPYFTRFVDSYMESRGLRKTTVVAASLGGRVALELAFEYPERVGKLVLVNTLGFGRPTVRMTYGLMTLPRVGETVMRAAGSALQWAPPPMIRRVAGRYIGATVDLERTLDDQYLEHLREMYAAEGYHDAYLATVRSLVSLRSFFNNDYDLSDRLPSIKIPVQLIWGADDPLFPLSHATRAHAAIPDCRLTVIEGAGHTPQAERPDEFNRALLAFLDA